MKIYSLMCAVTKKQSILYMYYKRGQSSERNSRLVEAPCQRAGGQVT